MLPSLKMDQTFFRWEPCVDGSDNRLGKFLFQIIEATRGGMPARDGNRSPRVDRSWGSRAKDFVICAEAACIDRLPYCNRGAVEVSWLYCCSYRGPIAQRTGMGIVEVVLVLRILVLVLTRTSSSYSRTRTRTRLVLVVVLDSYSYSYSTRTVVLVVPV